MRACHSLRAAPLPAETIFFKPARSCSVSVTLYFTTGDSFPWHTPAEFHQGEPIPPYVSIEVWTDTRRLLTRALLASWSSRSRQNSTTLTGCPTSGMRMCLLKYQYRLLPTRTGFFASQGIGRATSWSCCSRPAYPTLRLSFRSPTYAACLLCRWLSTLALVQELSNVKAPGIPRFRASSINSIHNSVWSLNSCAGQGSRFFNRRHSIG